MGGEWPTRPVRKVQLAADGVPTVPGARQGRAHTGGPPTAPRPAPQGDEELFEMTMLNPTLLSEMSLKTRFLFLEARADGKEAAERPPC